MKQVRKTSIQGKKIGVGGPTPPYNKYKGVKRIFLFCVLSRLYQ